MRPYECANCGQMLYFENTRCIACGASLGYLPGPLLLTALEPAGEGLWRTSADPDRRYRYCDNHRHAACNWLVSEDETSPWCAACQLNNTVPDLSNETHAALWRKLEVGKHRLVYALLRLGLPTVSKQQDPERGLEFDFLAEQEPVEFRETERVMTGHASGLITINIAEADDVERERQRRTMAEPYRTLLGHLRHEVGHYYWERLVRDTRWLAPYRQLFGDEREDYSEALERHYKEPRADWADYFVSCYASCHSWEDWAETWAHYMHIVDTMETAYAYGLQLNPRFTTGDRFVAGVDFDPYTYEDFDHLLDAWFPITYAVNSLNRSMGQPDLYPFVLAQPVCEKLRFVHGVIHGG